MLPIKLKIQGINSYQKEQVINFQNLLESKIFGIFGEVGSGKSSILEAISYALYGQMEKMNKNDKINYNFMNLKSNKFLVDFEFESENDKKYRFVVEGKRNSKQFEDVKVTRSYYVWSSNEWLPKEQLKAENIIGLSYENFKRTIIIPQGKFMDFIQLKDADRTKMLKEIFNLQKYDLKDRVGQLQRRNNDEIARLIGVLSQLVDVSEDVIKDNLDALEKVVGSRKELVSELSEQEIEFKELDVNKKLFEELSKNKTSFESLKALKLDFEQKEKSLKEYEVCALNFAPLMDNKKSIENKINSNQRELLKLKDEELELKKKLKLSKQNLRIAEEKFKNLDILKKKSDELSKIVSLKDIEEEIVKSINVLEKEKGKNINLISQKKTIEKEITVLNEKLKQFEKESSNLTKLLEIKDWLVKHQNQKQIIDEVNNELNKKSSNLKALELKGNEIISDNDLKVLNLGTDIDISDISKALDIKLSSFILGVKSLQNEKEELVVKGKLKDFAETLEEGESCPVCGSKHHPDLIDVDHVNDDILKLNKRIKKGEDLVERIRSYSNKYKILIASIDSDNKVVDELKGKLRVKEAELIDFEKTFVWDTYKNISLVQIIEKIEKENILYETKNKYQQDYNDLIKSNKEWQDKMDRSNVEMAKASEVLNSFMTKQDLLLKQLEVISYSDFLSKKSEDVKLIKEELSTEIINIEKGFKLIEQEVKTLELNLKVVETKVGGFEKVLDELKKEFLEINAKIELKIEELKFDSIEKVQNILNRFIDIVSERKEIEDFKIKFETTKNEISKLELKLKGKRFDIGIYNGLIEKIKDLKLRITVLDNTSGKLNSIIKKLNLDLIEKKKYISDLDIQELRKDDLKLMKSLFMSNGFVNYISTVRLQEVVNYANNRFVKLTRGRMKLILSENNSFNVIDFLNGGKQRSVKTLSGGQTFQASLSLALALASIVQQQNKSKQNFFFLDEGFGTQDEESLRLVFNTIKSLRKENRIIGLISHVPELKEEISTYLEIVNDDHEGSKVLTSW